MTSTVKHGSSAGFRRQLAANTMLVVALLAGAALIDAPHAAAKQVRPTVVLVHGAWADTSSWSGEVSALQRQGFVVRAVGNPLRGLTTDAATVAAFLHTVDGPIVLVG